MGALAGIGILIKLIGVPAVQKHNQSEKVLVESIVSGIKAASDGSYMEIQGSIQFSKMDMRVTTQKEFTVTYKDVDHDCGRPSDQEIDLLTSQFKKVFITFHGYH